MTDASPDDVWIGQTQTKQGANKFEVLQPARGQLADDQVMNFEAERRYAADAKPLQPALPTLRQRRKFWSDDIDIKP